MSAQELCGVPAQDLRSAIHEITPDIPQLALYLEEDPFVIRNALLGAMSLGEVPPCAEAVFDKAERCAIFSATGTGLNALMIEGTAREARFKEDPSSDDDYFFGIWTHFTNSVAQFEPLNRGPRKRAKDLMH